MHRCGVARLPRCPDVHKGRERRDDADDDTWSRVLEAGVVQKGELGTGIHGHKGADGVGDVQVQPAAVQHAQHGERGAGRGSRVSVALAYMATNPQVV